MNALTATFAPLRTRVADLRQTWARHRALRVGVVLAIVVAVIVFFPARLAAFMLGVSGPLLKVDARGTIWSGSATATFGQPDLRRPVPGELRWTLRFAGGPHLAATHPGLAGELRLEPTWGGLRASPQTLRLPANLLGGLHPRLNVMVPDGELRLTWPATVIGWSTPPLGSERLDLRWNAAGSWLTMVRPMGAYRIVFTQADGDQTAIALSTLVSPLMLQGQGMYSAGTGLRLDGMARFDPATTREARVALRGLLNAIGQRREDHYQLSLQ